MKMKDKLVKLEAELISVTGRLKALEMEVFQRGQISPPTPAPTIKKYGALTNDAEYRLWWTDQRANKMCEAGRAIVRAFEAKGISDPKIMAAECGYSLSYFYAFLRGERNTTVRKINRVYDAVGDKLAIVGISRLRLREMIYTASIGHAIGESVAARRLTHPTI